MFAKLLTKLGKFYKLNMLIFNSEEIYQNLEDIEENLFAN